MVYFSNREQLKVDDTYGLLLHIMFDVNKLSQVINLIIKRTE